MVNRVRQTSMTTRTARLDHLSSQWIYIPFHESSGTVAENRGTFGAAELSATGTTTSIYANRGFITPNAANTWITFTQATYKQFMRLDTLDDVGGMLVGFRIFTGGMHITGTQAIFSNSDNNATDGGYGVRFPSSTNALRVTYREQGGGSTTNLEMSATYSTAVEHSVVCYWDCVNDVIGLYVDGASDKETNMPAGSHPALADTLNGELFRESAGTPSANSYINSNSGTHRIGDFWMVRCTTDVSASVLDIAQEFEELAKEMPIKALLRAGL